MLMPAQIYEEEIKRMNIITAYDEKYKYYHGGYTDVYAPANTTWGRHEFASVNSKGELIGFISYNINMFSYVVTNLAIINYTDDKMTFGMDVATAVDNMFTKYGVTKLECSVYIGNPIEKSYDRLIQKYGGRIVGVKRKAVRLSDGRYYDEKLYEILKDDFIVAKLSLAKSKSKSVIVKAPESCYTDFGSDLDGCFRQSTQGCKGCSVAEEIQQ